MIRSRAFRYHHYFLLFVGLVIALTQSSCRTIREESRLIIASSGKIVSIDPAQASTFHALQILSALGDPLYTLDEKGNLEPRLAKELPHISQNGLTISIPLREGILFHDGTKFNAEAMVFKAPSLFDLGSPFVGS